MRRKIIIVLGLGTAFAAGVAVPQGSATASAMGGAPAVVYCRGGGKMSMEFTSSYVQLVGKRSGGAPGSDGVDLGPGECAWADRRLAATENPRLRFNLSSAPSKNAVSSGEVARCANNRNCMFSTAAVYDSAALVIVGPIITKKR